MLVSISRKLFPGTTARCLSGRASPGTSTIPEWWPSKGINGDQFTMRPYWFQRKGSPPWTWDVTSSKPWHTYEPSSDCRWELGGQQPINTGTYRSHLMALFTLSGIFWDLICVDWISTWLLTALQVLPLNVTALRCTPAQVFVGMWIFIFWLLSPRVQFLCCVAKTWSFYEKSPNCFSQRSHRLLYLPPLQGEHSLLVALPTVGNVTISYGTQFDRCGEIAHCTFNLHFPNG